MKQSIQEMQEKTISQIAKEHLFIDTLEIRNSDRLDFYDCGVGGIKAALKAAYEAGRLAEKNKQ